MKPLFAVLTALLLVAPLQARAGLPETGTAEVLPAASSARGATLSGVIVETMDSSGYTYLLLDTGSEKAWVAVDQSTVQVGDRVDVSGLLPMDDFYSRTLDRTFDRIYFASSILPDGAGGTVLPPGHPEIPGFGGAQPAGDYELPAGHPEVPGYVSTGDPSSYALPEGHPEIPGMGTPVDVDVTAVEPVTGGMKVADVYAGKTELAGSEVRVRGTVTKVNNGILGRNWIHLKDGSGEQGTDDLTVTSDQTARVGDTVVVRGVVGLDRDFGGGYFYDVLLEDAVLKVE